MKKKLTVDFDEIFEYAEKQFNIDWNTCNEWFFRDQVLRYKGYNDIDEDIVSEHFYEMREIKFENLTDNNHRAWYIIRQFMIDNKIKSMLVLND